VKWAFAGFAHKIVPFALLLSLKITISQNFDFVLVLVLVPDLFSSFNRFNRFNSSTSAAAFPCLTCLAACPLLLAAAAAATPEMNRVILNLKVAGFNLRPANVIKVRSLDINDTPTFQTNKVMMLVQLGVEARRRARMAGPGYEAEGSKRCEDAVNRHSGDLRQLAANGTVKLLSGRMIRATQDRLKNSAALRSDR
jgi:hypothetical protein